MSTLGVTRVGEALCHGTPLHGEVVVVIERSHLVDTPAEGAVVEDDAGLVALPWSISSVVDVLLLSTANADETDDVVATRLNRIIAQGDAWRRGCLSENCDVVCEFEVRLQRNHTSHIEDDDLIARLDCLSERAGSAVIEIRYVYDFAASTTRYVSSVTFGSRKGRGLRHGCCADERSSQ